MRGFMVVSTDVAEMARDNEALFELTQCHLSTRAFSSSTAETNKNQRFVSIVSADPAFCSFHKTLWVLTKGLKSAQKALCCQATVKRKQQEKDKIENLGFLVVIADDDKFDRVNEGR